MSQPFRFILYMADGTTSQGGAETPQLTKDYILHCLRSKDVKSGWYLGRDGRGRPKQIARNEAGA